jgi:hypothetical protein
MTAGARFSGTGDFFLGATISGAFSLFWRNSGRFLLIAGLAGLPEIGVYWIEDSLGHGIKPSFTNGTFVAGVEPSSGSSTLMNLFSIVAAVLSIFAQATIMHNSFAIMSGRDVPVRESLRSGISRFWPLIGLGILFGLGTTLGFILLVVPGFILVTMWFAALPACVVERLGPIRSLRRSAVLTKGHRWKLFGLLVLLIITFVVVAGLAESVLDAFGGPVFAIGEYALQVLIDISASIMFVVVYHNLRVAREGIGMDRIAAVFE